MTLAGIVAIGSNMRLHNLDAWGFWEDEYLTEERAHFSGKQVFKHYVTSKSLTFYGINSLNGWAVKKIYNVSTFNEVQLRWPMALAGVLGILMDITLDFSEELTSSLCEIFFNFISLSLV